MTSIILLYDSLSAVETQ